MNIRVISSNLTLFLFLQCILSFSFVTAGFPSGTLIKVKNGFIPIEQVQNNDKILSPGYSYFFTEKPVTYTQKRTTDTLLQISIDKDSSFLCSKETQFYIPKEKQWLQAQFLNVGDNLLQQTTGRLKIKDIKSINGSADVFDITTGNNNIFCISKHAFLVNGLVQPSSMWNSFCSWISNEGPGILTGSLEFLADFTLKKMTGENKNSNLANKEFMYDEKSHDELVDEIESRYENKVYNTKTSINNSYTSNKPQNLQALITCNGNNFLQNKIVKLKNVKPVFCKTSCGSILSMNPCMGFFEVVLPRPVIIEFGMPPIEPVFYPGTGLDDFQEGGVGKILENTLPNTSLETQPYNSTNQSSVENIKTDLQITKDIVIPDNTQLSTPIPDKKSIEIHHTPKTPSKIEIIATPIPDKKPTEVDYTPIPQPKFEILTTPKPDKALDNEPIYFSEKKNGESKTSKTPQDIVGEAKPQPGKKGKKGKPEKQGPTIYEKPGGAKGVYNDFWSMNPTGVEDKGGGKLVGYLPDGTVITARPDSKGKLEEGGKREYNGPPTLDIQYPDKSLDKIRYLALMQAVNNYKENPLKSVELFGEKIAHKNLFGEINNSQKIFLKNEDGEQKLKDTSLDSSIVLKQDDFINNIITIDELIERQESIPPFNREPKKPAKDGFNNHRTGTGEPKNSLEKFLYNIVDPNRDENNKLYIDKQIELANRTYHKEHIEEYLHAGLKRDSVRECSYLNDNSLYDKLSENEEKNWKNYQLKISSEKNSKTTELVTSQNNENNNKQPVTTKYYDRNHKEIVVSSSEDYSNLSDKNVLFQHMLKSSENNKESKDIKNDSGKISSGTKSMTEDFKSESTQDLDSKISNEVSKENSKKIFPGITKEGWKLLEAGEKISHNRFLKQHEEKAVELNDGKSSEVISETEIKTEKITFSEFSQKLTENKGSLQIGGEFKEGQILQVNIQGFVPKDAKLNTFAINDFKKNDNNKIDEIKEISDILNPTKQDFNLNVLNNENIPQCINLDGKFINLKKQIIIVDGQIYDLPKNLNLNTTQIKIKTKEKLEIPKNHDLKMVSSSEIVTAQNIKTGIKQLNNAKLLYKVSRGMYDQYQKDKLTEDNRLKATSIVLKKYKETGEHLSSNNVQILDDVLISNGIKVTNKRRMRLQEQCAINLLQDPNYFKFIGELFHDDDNYTVENKYIIKNIEDVFVAVKLNKDLCKINKHSNLTTSHLSFSEKIDEKMNNWGDRLAYNIESFYCFDTEENLRRRRYEWDKRIEDEKQKERAADKLEEQSSTVLYMAQNGYQQTVYDKQLRYAQDCFKFKYFNEKIPKHDPSKTLRVMTYNVGGWQNNNMNEVFKIIETVNPDVVCLQEMSLGKTEGNPYESQEFIKKFTDMGYDGGHKTFGYNKFSGNAMFGVMMFSKHKFISNSCTQKQFEQPDKNNLARYSFVSASILFNKKPVLLCTTKVDPFYNEYYKDTDGSYKLAHCHDQYRKKQITELVNHAKNHENVFICGDFGEPLKSNYSELEWKTIEQEDNRRNVQTTTHVGDGFKDAGYKDGLEISKTRLPFTNWSGTVNDLGFTKEPKKGSITIDKIYSYFSSISGHIPVIFDLSIKN